MNTPAVVSSAALLALSGLTLAAAAPIGTSSTPAPAAACGPLDTRETPLSPCVPAVVEQSRTIYYKVSAVNAAGEGSQSNEVAVVLAASADDFNRFVADSQAAAYYAKWVRDNPRDSARWAAYRDALVAGQRPPPPVMTTKYGAGLVDGGVLFADTP